MQSPARKPANATHKRWPNDESHAKHDAARQDKWRTDHQTERATTLRKVMSIVRDLAAAQYENGGNGRFVHYSFNFYLSKLTDFEFTGTPEAYLRSTRIAEALHAAIDLLVADLFNEGEMAWFVRKIEVDGDCCSLGVDIAMKPRY